MGWVFLASLAAGRLRGMPRGYVETREALSILRGRLDPARLLETVFRPDLVPCIFDSYSENIAINRLFRWAAEVLASDVVSPRLATMLQQEALALSDLTGPLPGLLEAERLILPPQHRELEPGLRIARLLLRGHSLVHRRGTDEVRGFLWKISEMFERFVFRLIRRLAQRMSGVVVSKDRLLLGTPGLGASRAFRTEPDVRVRTSTGTRLVLDAKYKTWTTVVPGRDDRYQVITGGWLVHCPHVGLVYPSLEGQRSPPLSWHLQGPGVPTTMVAIFVNMVEMADRKGERRLVADLLDDLTPYL